jgi:hypothetical protein
MAKDAGNHLPEGVTVVYSPRRRRPAFSLTADGALKLLLPQHYPARHISRLLDENSEVIARLRRRLQRRAGMGTAAIAPEFRPGAKFRLLGEYYPIELGETAGFDGMRFIVGSDEPERIRRELLGIYLDRAREIIGRKVVELAARHRIEFRTVKINAASSRWGSCSPAGNLNFTWKLIRCPEVLVDYVIAHELAHRREMNHSAAFWREVERLSPNARVWKKLIRREEAFLIDWPPAAGIAD